MTEPHLQPDPFLELRAAFERRQERLAKAFARLVMAIMALSVVTLSLFQYSHHAASQVAEQIAYRVQWVLFAVIGLVGLVIFAFVAEVTILVVGFVAALARDALRSPRKKRKR